MKHIFLLIVAAIIAGLVFTMKGAAAPSGSTVSANNPANRVNVPRGAPAGLVPSATSYRPSVPAYPPGQAPLNLLNPIADYNPNASVFSFDQKGATSAAGPTPWIPTIQPTPLPPTPSLGPMPYPLTGNIYGPNPIANNLTLADPSVLYFDSTAVMPPPVPTIAPGPAPVGQLGATPSSFWSADGVTNDLTMDPNSVTA